jgi:hypothetical protein
MVRRYKNHKLRKGAALLMCLFLVFMTSSLVLNVVGTQTLQFAATRNTIQYDQALYWANAGVHHACAELIQDDSFRGLVSDGVVPPSASPEGYEAIVADDGGGNLVVTSTGYSDTGERTVQATIQL